MYFGESAFDNDHEVFELSRADRQAARGWRFRHHRGAASRILIAARASAKELIRRASRAEKPGIALADQRLSY